MKSFLLSISSLTSIAPVNSIFLNNSSITHQFNNNQIQTQNEQTGLINNSYGYLSNTNWITNQSNLDHQFYSYDISHANYLLSNGVNARTTFMVDEQGNLVYKSDADIPQVDVANLNNTKAEIIESRKITTIKNSYNPISNSQYSDQYFDSGFTDWKYMQFGGREKPISIAGQIDAEKIQNYENLSETLGLYYFAKAVRTASGIDLKVANQLGWYFIQHSSLKNKLDQSLVDSIIKLISINNLIYHFIYQTPFNNSDKLYSLNFIFDQSNNLIAIYYKKWLKINTNTTGYCWNHTYIDGGYLLYNDESNTYTWLDWISYAKTWNAFVMKFPTFNFNQSNLKIFNCHEKGNVKSTNFSKLFYTSMIRTKQIISGLQTNIVYTMIQLANDYFPMAVFTINIWHDNQNIYFKWNLHCFYETNVSFKLGLVSFNP